MAVVPEPRAEGADDERLRSRPAAEGTPDAVPERDSPAAVRHLAAALVAELRRHGAEPLVLVSLDRSPVGPVTSPEPFDARARAASANAQAAQVLVSIQFDGRSAPAAGGVRAFYFGTERWQSVAGRTLAELIVRNVADLVGLRSDGAHARAFPLLRETRMPAVQVEPSRPESPASQSCPATPAAWSVYGAERTQTGRVGANPAPR